MINWNTIDTVLLDMDGTLLDLHFDTYFWTKLVPAKYAEQLGIPVDEAKAIYTPLLAKTAGSLQWYCLDFWSEALSLDLVSLKREAQDLIRFRPHAEVFLKALKNTSKTVIMITNAHRDTLSFKLERLPMAHYFTQLISSHDYGYPKEHPQFWQILESRINLDKQRALFIDDTDSILDAAKTYGIAQILTIETPDSHKPPVNTGGYKAVKDFRDLLANEGTL
ncbi:GMP/IMP nucleotidase [Candidatus Sororendozoicomonas aggregata]|uniref:GMP/IMP nucleotidase n=1 Tax=Candidatus Sororendozoicomonas aggregata TaxID=3073239 RepID=UPI002ED44C05